MILDEFRFCRREIWTPAKKPVTPVKKPAGETTRHERVATRAPDPGPEPQARSYAVKTR